MRRYRPFMLGADRAGGGWFDQRPFSRSPIRRRRIFASFRRNPSSQSPRRPPSFRVTEGVSLSLFPFFTPGFPMRLGLLSENGGAEDCANQPGEINWTKHGPCAGEEAIKVRVD